MSGLFGRRATALAGCAVTVLLCACGGGTGGPESTAMRPTGGAAEHKTSRPPESASHHKAGNETSAKHGKARDRDASAPKAEVHATPDDSAASRSTGSCPDEMSERLCAQVTAIREQQGDTPPRRGMEETGKCSATMSPSVCKAVTQAYEEGLESEEGSGGGSAPEPGKCPPMMPPAQCVQLTKAYAEATK
jgi:hypothetical protein